MEQNYLIQGLLLDSLSNDSIFMIEIVILLSCFLYFWFNVVFYTVKVKPLPFNSFNGLYLGDKSRIELPLSKFHRINRDVRVGSSVRRINMSRRVLKRIYRKKLVNG